MTRDRIFKLAALMAALGALTVPAAVLADGGTTTTTTTTGTTTTTTTGPTTDTPSPSPFGHPQATYVFKILTKYGVVHGKYLPLPGSLIAVYNQQGKIVRTGHTGANGVGQVVLPGKGSWRVKITHADWHGYHLSSSYKWYTLKAPMFRMSGMPDSPITLGFCVAGTC